MRRFTLMKDSKHNKNVTRTFLLRKTRGPDLTLFNTFMSIINERPTKFVIFCQILSINRENMTSITNMTDSTFKFSICDLGFKGLVNYICWNCGNFMIFPSCKAFQISKSCLLPIRLKNQAGFKPIISVVYY